MDMSSMMSGGMDMSSDGMFRTFNQALAEDYWYIILAILGFIVLLRGVDYYQTSSRYASISNLHIHVEISDALQIKSMSVQKISGLPDESRQFSYADICYCNSYRPRS